MNEQQWLEAFGNNLKDLLREYGVTQRELSKASLLPEKNISQYINGRTMPTIPSIVAIAEALECSYDDLMDIR